MKKDVVTPRPYNVFAHAMVPKHELLGKRDADELMRALHISPHQLPYLKVGDPAAQALGAKVGDVVRIIRDSATAGEAVAYRYVVEG